ncbi:hypothetical protein RUM43_000612 [Polyplax serrata]|uniref:Uncharacterized protein n=1 Tax=Polyplax serrata TaxID=468196 RepID=A0AAN8SHE6_POLSC
MDESWRTANWHPTALECFSICRVGNAGNRKKLSMEDLVHETLGKLKRLLIVNRIRKENEEMLNSLSRQGAIKEATTAATTTTTTVLTQLNATGASSSLGNFSGRL